MSYSRMFAVARAQWLICKSRVRFWIIAIILALFALIGYLQACVFQTLTAPYSPSFSLTEPMHLLTNVDPLVFVAFQIAAVFLAFDVRELHQRERVQAVVESHYLTNFEYLLGSVLGPTALLFSVALITVLGLQTIGYTCNIAGWMWGDIFETTSVFNLLVIDAFPLLFLWCAVALALTCIFRSRLMGAFVSVSLILGCYVLNLLVPFSLLSVVSPLSNDSLITSELLPDLAPLSIISIRLCTVIGALGLLLFASAMMKRWDRQQKIWTAPLGVVLSLGSVATFTGLSLALVSDYYKPDEWLMFHVEHSWNSKIDLQTMEGNLDIDPGKSLALDLTYQFQIQDHDSNTGLLFTLNPGMQIESVQLNGNEVSFGFDQGLLVVDTPSELKQEQVHQFSVKAKGQPDSRFSYIDSPIDYFRDRNVSRRVVQLFGHEGSIFEESYVALMPGSYWYPVPGPRSRESRYRQGEIDFFHVNVSASVPDSSWLVVSTDTSGVSDSEGRFEVQPQQAISEVAIFATEFEKFSLEASEISFDLYLHKTHTQNVEFLSDSQERLQEEIEELLEPFEESGMTYPFQRLSLIEVPNRLRTLNGGFFTESVQVLPGMFLLKERGFPLVRFNIRVKRIERWEDNPENYPQHKVGALRRYYRDAVATDNLWTGFPNLFWTQVTSAEGEHALVLNRLILDLIVRVADAPDTWFSPYSTYHVANMTQMSLPTVEWAVEEGSGGDTADWTGDIAQEYLERMSIWSTIETQSLLDISIENPHQSDLEVMLAKCRVIAAAITHANGEDRVFEWLSAIREQYAGTSFTLDDFTRLAAEKGITVEPFLSTWLEGTGLPGYLVSELLIDRPVDDEEGNPRYQTSFHVFNNQSTEGVFWFAYPRENNRRGRWPRSDAVFVDGDSSVRVNLTTTYPINYIYFIPSLSLNRTPLSITPLESVAWESRVPAGEPRPFVEPSDWRPSDEGIVIDDLDPGFLADQPPDFKQSSTIGPLGWFRLPRLEADNDQGLPVREGYIYRSGPGRWGRYIDENSFGRYRRTGVIAVNHEDLHPVRFSTEIPETSRWRLEYFINTYDFERWQRKGDFLLEIENTGGSKPSAVTFENAEYGWNIVGEFELLEGDVRVSVVGASKDTNWIYADAIRWVEPN